MDPMYRNMHSYPHQSDQKIHYSPHFYPGTEPISPQMYTNPTRPPVNYGWPWGINYGYPFPFACHGCCNQPYFTNPYPFGSPYSHHAPQPHCPVSYPSFPVQHIPPHPPCYPMELPLYEFEKNVPMGGQHCCGCPNHKSHEKEQRNVRIEEEELPDGERTRNDSLVPLQIKNGTCPVVWTPSDYGNKKEQGGDNYDCSVVPKDGTERGWYPLDLNKLVSSEKQMGDEERKHKQDGDGEGHFPFPLFWIPYKSEEKEKEIEKHFNYSNTKPSSESEKGPHGDKKSHLIGEDIGGRRVKDIKVKEVENHEEKEIFKKEKERPKNGIDHSEKKVDLEESKLSKENVKRKSSPPKSSKLPPVCLRVDPLPRRKSANQSSPSPSTSGDKQKPELQSNQAKGYVINSLDNKNRDKIPTNEGKECKGMKIIEVVDGKARQEKHMDVDAKSCVNKPEEHISRECIRTDAIKGQSEEGGFALGKNEELLRDKDGRGEEAKETIKRKLSEEEAVVIIQSAYRGFDTRRWEPIKKLKEIAKVREQIANVNHIIQEMESSSDIHGSCKQRNVISETIMSLLLKLDTIQGLHPSIREVRKSVVKELVSLQEKLDSLLNRKSGDPPHQESKLSCAASNKIEDVISSYNGSENHPDGAFNYENLEEGNPNGEESIEKLEKEEEKNLKNEDENCDTLLENAEISHGKDDDHGDLVFEQRSELPVSHDSSENMTDFSPSDGDKLDSELAELPQKVHDSLCAQKNIDQKTIDPDAKKACEEKRLIEEEAPISFELHNHANEKENNDDVLDHPLGGRFNVDKTGDDKLGPEGCIDQSPQNVTSGIVEPSEASDDKRFLIAETCDEINTDVLSGKAIDNPPGMETFSQLQSPCNSEQDAIGVENMAGEEFKNGTTDSVKNLHALENANEDDMLPEKNRELIEENERLRGIMENLIKSGQEQLTAISSLTGRVKDLERKLSKKTKLKVKKRKSNKMRALAVLDEE